MFGIWAWGTGMKMKGDFQKYSEGIKIAWYWHKDKQIDKQNRRETRTGPTRI